MSPPGLDSLDSHSSSQAELRTSFAEWQGEAGDWVRLPHRQTSEADSFDRCRKPANAGELSRRSPQQTVQIQ